ncbi:MAG: hypothetical protein K9W42_12230 [Candidatus Heimdallarchaeota archaeon]|nr:hypothetical protein [Candidatus Heimdallarchaeota archaeon]
MNGSIRELAGAKKKHLSQAFLTVSFASFTIFVTLVIVTAIIALKAVYLDEIWYLIMLIALIVAGGSLIPGAIISLQRKTKEKITEILLITIPIVVAIIPAALFYRYLVLYGFKDHYALVEAYMDVFQERMWKITNQLLICSVLIAITIGTLAIIKLRKKEGKQNSPFIVLAALNLPLLLLEIIGRVFLQKVARYALGDKMFWGAGILFAGINLVSYYFILQEIELPEPEDTLEQKQMQKESAKAMTIIGAAVISASMIWLIATVKNSQLVVSSKRILPASYLPQLALYAFGTTIIAYSLLKKEKAREKQKYSHYLTIITISIIIPLKVFGIWLIWNWLIKNSTLPGITSWYTKAKPFTLILTDLLPLAAFLLGIGYSEWQEKKEKKRNSWMVIIPSITMIASVTFVIIVAWLLWGAQYDLDNFSRLFTIANSIAIIELTFLMIMMGYELIVEKKKPNTDALLEKHPSNNQEK